MLSNKRGKEMSFLDYLKRFQSEFLIGILNRDRKIPFAKDMK